MAMWVRTMYLWFYKRQQTFVLVYDGLASFLPISQHLTEHLVLCSKLYHVDVAYFLFIYFFFAASNRFICMFFHRDFDLWWLRSTQFAYDCGHMTQLLITWLATITWLSLFWCGAEQWLLERCPDHELVTWLVLFLAFLLIIYLIKVILIDVMTWS